MSLWQVDKNSSLLAFQFLPQKDLARSLRVCGLWRDLITKNALQIYKAQGEITGQLSLSSSFAEIHQVSWMLEIGASVRVRFPLRIFRVLFLADNRCHLPLRVFYKKDGTLKTTDETIRVSHKGKRFVLTCVDSYVQPWDQGDKVSFDKALQGRIYASGPSQNKFITEKDIESCKQEAAEETRDFIPVTDFPTAAEPKVKDDQKNR